jgi:hypothetical protein
MFEKTQLIKEQEYLRNQLSIATAKCQQKVQQLTDERDDLRSQLDRVLPELDRFKKMSELTPQRKAPDSQQCRPPSHSTKLWSCPMLILIFAYSQWFCHWAHQYRYLHNHQCRVLGPHIRCRECYLE